MADASYVPTPAPRSLADRMVSVLADDVTAQAMMIARYRAKIEELQEIAGGLSIEGVPVYEDGVDPADYDDEQPKPVAYTIPVKTLESLTAVISRIQSLSM